MASTYSALKIELIATGEQVNVWGSTTNTNLGTALEEAIVGRTVASFTTDGNLTIDLTNTNATQVARHYILSLTSTGALTATRDLIVPSIDKPYIIENNTTGAQSIRVKTTAGTGVTVPNGKTAMVYANSTNVVSALSYVPALSIDTATLATAAIATAAIAAGTATFSAATITTATINGGTITGITDLAVADGGTGLSTLTANNVILGNGASAPTFVAPGTTGNVLTSNGTTWASTTPATTVSSFSAGTTGFTPSATTTGAVTLAGTLAVANGGTGVTTSTGTTNVVLSNSPTLVSPSISSAVMTTMASSVLTRIAVATSGTTIPFTDIPSWVKRITVMFGGLATNGSAQIQVQLGSGSTTASGYAANAGLIFESGGISTTSITTGFPTGYGSSGQRLSGNYTIANVTGNLWACSGSLFLDTSRTTYCGGRVTLGGVLDRVVISTVGADTFNTGSVNIFYE